MTIIYNNGDEVIPPFAIVQIDDGIEERNGHLAFNVKQPAGEIRPSMYLINDRFPVHPKEMGGASNAVDAIWCLFDSDNTPVFDEDWGAVSGSWKLGKTGTGFRIVGKEPVKERVIVQLQIGPQLFMAKVDEASGIAVPSFGTFNRIDGSKGGET